MSDLLAGNGCRTSLQAFGSGCCVIMGLGKQANTATARERSATAFTERIDTLQRSNAVYVNFYIDRSTPDLQSDSPNRVRADMNRQPGLPAETELAQLQDCCSPRLVCPMVTFWQMLWCSASAVGSSGPPSLAATSRWSSCQQNGHSDELRTFWQAAPNVYVT